MINAKRIHILQVIDDFNQIVIALGVSTYMFCKSIHIQTLNSFVIYDDKWEIITLGKRPKKLWQLFKLLLIHFNQPVHYEIIFEQLAIEKTSDIHNLIKNMIYRLRKHLIKLEMYNEALIQIEYVSENYVLKLGKNISLDLARLYELSVMENPIEKLREIENIGCELFSEERYAEWVLQKRSYYSSLYAKVCLRVAELLYLDRKFDDTLALANRVLEIYPDDESVHVLILKSYLNQGNRVNALKFYYELEDRLYEEYGIDPSLELQKIAKELNEVQTTTQNKSVTLNGAMWCSPKEFKTIIQHEKRKHQRGASMPIYCKVKVRSRLDNPQIFKTISQVGNLITDSLRMCDIISEVSTGTFHVLLYNTSKEHVALIEERVKNKILKNHIANDIYYQIEFE